MKKKSLLVAVFAAAFLAFGAKEVSATEIPITVIPTTPAPAAATQPQNDAAMQQLLQAVAMQQAQALQDQQAQAALAAQAAQAKALQEQQAKALQALQKQQADAAKALQKQAEEAAKVQAQLAAQAAQAQALQAAASQSAFDPSENKTYVDVNLAAQVLTYYKDGEAVLITPCVTGSPGRSTPSGVFMIDSMVPGKYLTGPTWHVWVDRWMRFSGNCGIHDASWRKAFGGDIYLHNGSHGCVNIPKDQAMLLYNMVGIGTIVVVH